MKGGRRGAPSLIHDLGLVATDVDGTLLGSDEKVAARTHTAVHAAIATGSRFVLATGRPPRWTIPIGEQLGVGGVAICANGAITYDLSVGRVIRSRLLEHLASLASLDAIREALPDAVFAVERVDGGFAHDPAYIPSWPTPAGTVVAPVRALLDGPVAKLLVRHDHLDPDELLANVARAIVGFGHATKGGNDRLIEVMAIGATKGEALAELAGEWGIDAHACVAFGDMPNDVEMLEWAGLGVAMGNAHPSVIAVADHVTHSNDDHGVAAVLEHLLDR